MTSDADVIVALADTLQGLVVAVQRELPSILVPFQSRRIEPALDTADRVLRLTAVAVAEARARAES